MIFLSIICIIQSIFMLSVSINKLSKKRYNAAILYYPVFFLIFPFHNILDITFGLPEYKSSIFSLEETLYNDNASIIYYIFIFIMNFIFFIFFIGKKQSISINSINVNKLAIISLWLIAFSGPLSILLTNNPSTYLVYGEIRNYIGQEQYDEYSLVWILSFFSSISVISLRFIYGKKINILLSILLISLLIIDLYINNKRFIYGLIIVYAVISFFYSTKRTFKFLNVLLSIIIFSVLYITYSFNYKYDYSQTTSEVYASTRHELSRDDVLRYVIQEKLLGERNIVEYSGQTYLSIIFGFVPRKMWPDKPYPYGQYLTNKVLHNNVGPALGTWTITTSLYDEAIANFGWYGFIFIFIFIVTILNMINKNRSLLVRSLLFIILVFYSFTNVNWFLPIVYFVILLILINAAKGILINPRRIK